MNTSLYSSLLRKICAPIDLGSFIGHWRVHTSQTCTYNYAISTSQEQAFEFGTRANIARLKQGNSIYPFQNFHTPTTYIVSLPNDYLSQISSTFMFLPGVVVFNVIEFLLCLQFEGYANNGFTCCSILKKDNAFVPSTRQLKNIFQATVQRQDQSISTRPLFEIRIRA